MMPAALRALSRPASSSLPAACWSVLEQAGAWLSLHTDHMSAHGMASASGACAPHQQQLQPQQPARGYASHGAHHYRSTDEDIMKPAQGSWKWMVDKGLKVNPCNSKQHPAVLEEGIQPEGEELSVQDGYTPKSACFGCGPANPDGLHLKSYRIKDGLEARISLPPKYCAFPGIINGGVLSTLMDCHGNWTAAVALMDRSCLPKPPLTLTASMLVSYREPTPPDTELVVRSKVVSLKDNTPGLGRATVEVDIVVLLPQAAGGDKVLATGTGIFKRMGALRAL